MPRVVTCPACGSQLNLPEALSGKPVRCPKCELTFTSPPLGNPCPVCASPIPDDADNCAECGFVLNVPSVAPEVPEKPNVCPNAVCGTLNPPGEKQCRRCNSPLPAGVGKTIADRFLIHRVLAIGGFGIVYQGIDQLTGEPVAVKEMIANDPREFAIRRTFFRREAEILGALQEIPAVPRLLKFVEDSEAAYLAIEFIAGDNLLNILEKPGAKPFPIATVCEWGITVCDALARMHGMSPPVIHRDMKPENIMLSPDGKTIRLIDFGTARELGSTQRERGVARTKVYTEGYAPPEQVIGRPEVRSDVFALAGTLYHLATGFAPEGFFTGRLIIDRLADYPVGERWFFELIGLNLSEDRNDRYPDIASFKRDLTARNVLRETNCPSCRQLTSTREPYCQTCAAAIMPLLGNCPKCDCFSATGCRFCVACGSRLS